ncbi:aromatic acid exporter family protein [Salinibacterium sp. TMP30]|uniref:FUSC family protein n=1 Tax=Salinibacterium sp. TMP30 TaxID=3138237 RepID=UPI003139ACB4
MNRKPLRDITFEPVNKRAWRIKSQITRARILHATKAAIAVGLAWTIAPYLPGVADNYPYYAPLGAIVSMYPTLMGSMKNALQTLGSLVVAIVLAGAVIVFSQPNVATMSIAVGVGALIASTGWFGGNREYIPVTVLFVLIIGGPDADAYSIGYLEQVSLGIVVGLLVNILIFPALSLDAVGRQLSNYRVVLADHLSEVAKALAESWPPELDGWASRKDALVSVSREVRAAVLDADDSRKANPRARLHRRDLGADYDDLAALEAVTFHVRDLTDVLAGAVWGTSIDIELRPELRPSLSVAIDAVSALLRDWDSDAAQRATHSSATAAVASLMKELAERRDSAPATSIGGADAIAMDLARILAALSFRVEQPEAIEDPG